ncbi:MAG: ATP-binding protein [Pseudomonadota bacterium]
MRRGVHWIGGLFIAVIVASAVYDILQAYRATATAIERELSALARVIGEQTARSFQAVDVQLRHLEQQYREGPLRSLVPDKLRAYLRAQAAGLVQADGLLLVDADGRIRASSYLSEAQEAGVNVSDSQLFKSLSARRGLGLFIDSARQSKADAQWMFPTGRRLETPGGEFAGVAAARSRIDYFQKFYSDLRLDEGTTVALMNHDGTLLVRHPALEQALGKRIPMSDGIAAAVSAGRPALTRTVSPLDGVDRFVAAQPVSDYGLTVFVTREAALALAPWRDISYKAALRMLAVSALAAFLLWLLGRQLARLQETRVSLQASRERFAAAVAGSDDGIWEFDFRTGRSFNSRRAQELVGMPPGPEDRPLDEWLALLPTYLHPDDVPRRREALEAHLAGNTPIYEVDVRHRQPDGSYRWMRIRGLCTRNAKGEPLRMAGSISDIDAYKKAEARRLQLEGQLLQAKKLEAIGTLAGGIAHDFNNILSAILGYGEMAQKGAKEGTALRRHLDAVVSAGLRAKSLVERILAFSRSGVGERAPVNVQAVVAEALDLAAASLPVHVRLERGLQAEGAAVMGDPTQIHQVVMNLCANAAQAMSSAGTLTVSLDVLDMPRSVVATSALAGGRYVRLSVRDTGGGIADEVRERIFDPFFTTKGVGVGTGLGLSMVHGIVTDLGGGIDVASRTGEGTTFTVYLPCSSAAVVAAGVEEGLPTGAGETVLLVDDEEPLVRLGEEMIAALGYEPVGFTSSAAALAEFRAAPGRFNAVLSDESMPEMTGTELAREVRRIRPEIPIVLMSGFVSQALSARARELGIAEVLSKPLVSRDIARGLASALRRGA